MQVRKKAAIILSTYLLTLYLYKKDIDETYVLNDDYVSGQMVPYATYKGKNIYIGSKKEIFISYGSDANGIYIIDERDDKDPNIRICNSYKIFRLKDMREILKMLKEYEEKDPSEWNRTYFSMLIEWIIHNGSFDVSYEKISSRSVDLNNEDEDILYLIKRII